MADNYYFLKSLTDFDKVPDDKLEDCLIDLLTWMRVKRATAKHAAVLSLRDPDVFHWIDDGEHKAHAKYYGPGGELLHEDTYDPAL